MKRSILLLQSLLFSLLICSSPVSAKQLTLVDDGWTTETLDIVAYADWTIPRDYEAMTCLEDRFQRMLSDFAFEEQMADKSREMGLELDETDRNIIESRKKQLLQEALKRKKNDLVPEPDDEQIEQVSKERHWNTPRPERYHLSYIRFSKDQNGNEEALSAVRQIAEKVAGQCTTDNFADQARMWSEAVSSLEGGNIGYISVEKMGPEFLSQVRKTPVGTVGGPYETKTGWNILWVKNHEKPVGRYNDVQKRQMVRGILAQQIVLSPQDQKEIAESVESSPELQALINARFTKKIFFKLFEEQKTDPSEKELLELYQELKEQLVKPRRWKGRELRLAYPQWRSDVSLKEKWVGQKALRDQAREIRQQVLDGTLTFAAAAEKSSAASTASSGGDLGWITSPANAFLDRIFLKLKPGEISAPMATKQGMVLIFLEDDNSEDRQMKFKECREQLAVIWEKRQFTAFHQQYRKEVEAGSRQ